MNDDYANPLDLEAQYHDMASDTPREGEAEEWIEELIADASAEE